MERCTIVGGGPVGTLMALLLERRGTRVRVLERRPDPRGGTSERGRSINLALAARGLAALQAAGVQAALAPQLIAMGGRMLHDERGTQQFMPYGIRPGEVIQAAGRAALSLGLIEVAAARAGIEFVFDARCLDVDPQQRMLSWREERTGRIRTEPFEVLLGADGAGSAVRAALCARGTTEVREVPLAHDYQEFELPAQATATGGYAFEPHALHVWPRGGFMLIALPNPGGTFTATLFLPRSGPVSFEQLGDAAAVTRFFEREFADAAALMPDLPDQWSVHPPGRLGTLYCRGWQAAECVLLIGDAAHAIVPFHGQGLNCGFEDCLLLERLLADGPARAFGRFEAERRADTDAIAAMALENYVEMRDGVRSPDFAQRRALAVQLEQAFPERFIPRYSMVMFHPEIPYREAQRRGAQQERIIDALLAGAPLGDAPRLLARAGL